MCAHADWLDSFKGRGCRQMRSLDTFNNGVGALNHWRSTMSLDDLDEEQLDDRILATCLH